MIQINIKQFILKHQFSDRDKAVMNKMYAGLEKTEAEWISEISGKISHKITPDYVSDLNAEFTIPADSTVETQQVEEPKTDKKSKIKETNNNQ